MDEMTVTIPLSRFEELIDTETRVGLLSNFTKNSKYSISREEVAHYVGFYLPIEEGKVDVGND